MTSIFKAVKMKMAGKLKHQLSTGRLFIMALIASIFLTSTLAMLQPGYAQEAASDIPEDQTFENSPAAANGNTETTPGCTVDSSGNDVQSFIQPVTYVISRIVKDVSIKLSLISAQIYNKLILQGDFLAAVTACIVLYIAIYGIMFMTGMIQISLHDFIVRLIKIGILVLLVTPTQSWLFFNTTVVKFFNESTNDIIDFLTMTGRPPGAGIPVIGTAIHSATAGSTAFLVIDGAVSKLISSKLIVTLFAISTNNVYGFLIGGLALWGIFQFLRSLFTALWVYIMSLVVKALLFGLAPIFIPTILFQRTRHLFDNWLNQIVNATLQPILLFIFYVFFIKLMEGSLDQILSHPVCWTKMPEGYRGSPFDFSFWRFAEMGPNGWRPSQTPAGPDTGFPIPIVEVLSFLLIADIANRFNEVVIRIASTISQASVDLSHGNPITGAMDSMGGRSTSLAKLNNSGLGPQR